ncbi:DsrE family protein [Novosphingobium sp. BW1]|uniref:DsrE family protein n=1 Tax=Novosphingobium sp. BW1 TaxID=2592621 RepID=UPI0011DEEC23|nr:DsrE family protein [Novosphingobium sp. BW1]TYC85507.1 DsrE family protein [Novosphingobium sp. BW1]
MRRASFLLSAVVALLPAATIAAPDARTGPVFTEYGRTFVVEPDMPIPADAEFKVAFDISMAAPPGEVNRHIDSAARFINIQVATGVPRERIHVAIVVHGPAGADLLAAEAYAARHSGTKSASAPLVRALLDQGVRVILCGQSAAAMDLARADLIPGVELALSAMTAHALLQQDGYTLNPF